MNKLKNKISQSSLIVIGLLLAGCLVSGTFIITHSFQFTAQSGFYFYQVNLTTEQVWKDHSDKIDFIDAVGVELYITSNEAGNVTFDAYVDNYSGAGSNPSSVPASATKIIDNLTVPPGSTKITYAQSLGLITNLSTLKTLAKVGQFDFYGTSSGNDGNTFIIDSGKVIVTFSAGY